MEEIIFAVEQEEKYFLDTKNITQKPIVQ